MLTYLLIGLSVFFSWSLSLAYIRMKPAAVLFNAGITALPASLASWILLYSDRQELLPPLLLILCLLETAAVQLQRKNYYGGSVLAMCIAVCTLGMFAPSCILAANGESLSALGLWSALCAGSAAFWFALKERFPDSDWREYFSGNGTDPARLNLRKEHVYAAAAVPCAGIVLLMTALRADKTSCTVLSSACFLLLWLSLLLMILMTSYRKERLAVLLEQQYRSEMEAYMNVIRSQRHDYNFHVQTISGLMAEGKIDACRSYVQALEKDSADMNAVMPVKDPAISATIFSFRTLAIRAGIVLHIDIQNDLSMIATNVYETNKILSNLLQNAIDEVAAHPDKSYGIRLTILKRGEFCVIRVSNKLREIPSAEHLGKLCQQGYTTKDGHEGVGLSSIKLLAQRYHGIVFAQTEGDVIHFTARIPINSAKQETGG